MSASSVPGKFCEACPFPNRHVVLSKSDNSKRNVASISSFYLEPVYRLIPVFDPFSMTSLLMFKIMIPFLIVSAVFASLTSQLRLSPFALFFVAVTMSDVLAINFFFLVTDKGSWLEIGRTSALDFLVGDGDFSSSLSDLFSC
jgi:Phosphatidylinositolglycan class N (PIG-N)